MFICKASQLRDLRSAKGMDNVKIYFSYEEFPGNLALYVIKFGLWALKKNGTLIIEAPNFKSSMKISTKSLSFQMLLQLAARASIELAEFIKVDLVARRFILRRVVGSNKFGWSAGVIFSGNRDEIPNLERCLKSLKSQPELQASGDIVVCGPKVAEELIPINSGVRFVPYETQNIEKRFLIGDKKNFLLRNLKNENAVICHSRIVLDENCLSGIPEDFDVITPRIYLKEVLKNGRLPYLDLGFVALNTVSFVGSTSQPAIFFNRDSWYQYLKSFYPYIDGGLFITRRSLALSIPLHSYIAWGEGEDVEWCLRLLHQGKLVELAMGDSVAAESITCKLPRYAKYGHLKVYRHLSSIFRSKIGSFLLNDR